MSAASLRLFVKLERDLLPRVSQRSPFLYLERGRLEVDDSSVKWIGADGRVLPIPVATLCCLLLGPGTSSTHDAVRTVAAAGTLLCWVGEDALLFYSTGVSPVAHTRHLRTQAALSSIPSKSIVVARTLFSRRFPDANLEGKTIKEMMGMEGHRVRALYQQKAEQYKVGWAGRSYTPGKIELSDLTNRIMTIANGCLYSVITSCVCALGFSPHLGFIHSGSPLPFVYDLADLYKEDLCIDLAFSLTLEMAGQYDKHLMSARLRQRMIDRNLVAQICKDLFEVLGIKEPVSKEVTS